MESTACNSQENHKNKFEYIVWWLLQFCYKGVFMMLLAISSYTVLVYLFKKKNLFNTLLWFVAGQDECHWKRLQYTHNGDQGELWDLVILMAVASWLQQEYYLSQRDH